MMADDSKLQPGNKTYDGKVSGEPFSVIHRCQTFTTDVYNATSGAPKDKRYSICRKLQDYSVELIHITRQSNEFDLFSQAKDRYEYRDNAIEQIKKIDDLLPVVRGCRCFSPKKESELHKKLYNLKESFNYWISSDNRRLREQGIEPPSLTLPLKKG